MVNVTCIHPRFFNFLAGVVFLSGMITLVGNSDRTAQAAEGPSAFCHVTDGAFTVCPDTNEEWSDITPAFFPDSDSYLYVDQADLDPILATPDSPVDTLMLMYDECSQTKPLGPDEYVRVGFTTVEVEGGFEKLEHYVIHIFTDGTIIFIEDGTPQTDGAGDVRVEEIESQRGVVGFGPSPNCAFDHVFAEFEIGLTAAGTDADGAYSPDPQFWGAQAPCDFKCALKEAAASKAAIAAIVGAAGFLTPCTPAVCGPIAAIWAGEAGVAFLIGQFDPPDPNFTILAEPQFPVFPPVQPGVGGLTAEAAAAVNALSDSHAQSLGLLNAWLATIERVQGAELAGDAFWVNEQNQLAAEFARQLIDVLANRDSLREAVRAGLIESGISDIEITADDIRAFQAEVLANGLPNVDLIEAIPVQAFGITNQDLIDVTAELILQVTPEDAARSLTETITDPQLIATTQSAAIHFAEFAQSVDPEPMTPQDLVNGNFETGDFEGWGQINGGSGGITIDDGTFDPPGPGGPVAPFEGSFAAATFQSGPGVHTLFRDVILDAGLQLAILSWADNIQNHAGIFSDPNQEWRVEVWDPVDNSVLAELFSTNPGDQLIQDWTVRSADLGQWIGQTIRLAFTQQDNLFFFNARLDQVRVLVDEISDDRDSDMVLNELDNCPATPNPDQADRNFNGIGDFCETGRDNSTAAFLQAAFDGSSTIEPTPLPVAEEPELSKKLVRIVEFRVEEGLTESAEELTQNLVDSLVDVGLVEEGQADALVEEVLSALVAVAVEIDIKPGSDPNCFNNDGHGVIPVAILGSDGSSGFAPLNASDIDANSVSLEGLGVALRGKNILSHLEDVNGDNLIDLVVQIEDMDAAFVEGSAMAKLTGQLMDGTPIEGTDSICLVP